MNKDEGVEKANEEMETYKKWFTGGLLAIIVIVIIGMSISSNNTKNTTTKI